ncbi:hypothetical protein KAU32_04615 [bacterium]|nr:hypothetical protein [bacterium]
MVKGILILLVLFLLPGYTKGTIASFSGKLSGKDISFKETLISASQKELDGKQMVFYFFKFKSSGAKNFYGSFLVSETGFLEKLSVSDSDRKLSYKLQIDEGETILKINESSGLLLKEIPQSGGVADGVFLPMLPACWHFLLRSNDLIKTGKYKFKAAVPLYDKEMNAGHPNNMEFAEHSEFRTVNIRIKLSSAGAGKYEVKLSPFNAVIMIDAEYNIISFKWNGLILIGSK